jgi:myo-inositol 2-dehydrogenase/D-chiro-inositol 1-dehydrogenase
MGIVHARNISQNANARLIGIADLDRNAAESAVASTGGRVDSAENFLADAAVHAVVIATPTDTHAELIVKSAAANKQIFCEKPISLDIRTTVQAIRACERAGVMLQIGFQRRFDRDFANVHTAIREGKLGDVRFIRLVSRDRTLPPIAYVRTSGGQYKDQMVHDFDAARWLLAPATVDEVTAVGSALADSAIGECGDVDTAVALLRFSNGAIALLDVSREAAYGYDVRTEVHGSRGMLLAGDDGLKSGSVLDASFVKPQTDSFVTRFSDAYRLELQDFVDAVATRKNPRVDGNDALQALRIAVAAERSRRSGCKVQLADVEGG